MSVTDFNQYQTEAMKTALYPKEHKVVYSALGLAGEAGELANKVKKLMRGDADREALVEGIKSEMGDVLWYLAALADDLGVTLEEVAEANIKKLQERQARGALKASGDNR